MGPWATLAVQAALLVAAASLLVGQEENPRDPRQAPPARAAPERDELARRLDLLLEDPALERAHVGLVVQVAETGEILFEHASRKRFVAASTAKLITAAAALDALGADFRWTTRLLASGILRGDTLEGDLWIVGGGDPTLTMDELRRWPRILRDAGIGHVAGDLIGDDRAFEGPIWGHGWSWEDVHSGWGAGVGALQLSPGAIPAELTPDPVVGQPTRLTIHGPPPPVHNRTRTGPPGSELRIHFVPTADGQAVRLEGWVPAGGGPVRLSLAPGHPSLHFLRVLRSLLQEAGIGIEGRIRRATEGEEPAPRLWEHPIRSETLADVLERFLKRSDNQIGETLLRTLGREARGVGSADAGREVVRERLEGWGISADAVSLADGSGLSRQTLVTPAALVRLLRRAWQLPRLEPLRTALPVASRDGTLARRLEATAASANLRAKTGSLAGVRGLAGYVTDADGETLVFALLVNGYDVDGDVAVALEDLLVEQLALYHGRDYLRLRARPPEAVP